MVDVGDVAMKIAGRDAGQICAVVEVLNDNYVLIDGETRRRKCNLSHLEFLGKKLKIKKGLNTEDIRKALKDLGFILHDVKKGKIKEKKEKQSRLRKTKKTTNEVSTEKKETKKITKKK